MTEKDIRKIMQNGEEKVPSRVWSAICDRLDSTAPATDNGWWKWGLALGSLAAAAIALLLYFGKIDTRPNVELTAEAIHLSETVPNNAAAAAVELETATAPAVAAKPASVQIPATSSETAPEVVSAAIDTCRQKQENTSIGKQTAARRQVAVRDPVADYFAGRGETPQDNKIFSLVAQGSIFGNDSDLIKGSSTQYKSPSSTTTVSNGITETGASTYGIPFSLGLGVRIGILERFSVGTGLTYSLLTRTFKGNFKQDAIYVTGADIRQTMHYIGIPVNAYYSIIDNNTIDFYVFGGGSMEFCVSNKYRISSSGTDYHYKDAVKGLQFSVALGLGVAFSLNDKLSIYLDPNARYYFPSSHPKSVRSDKPFMFVLEAGLKFNL